MTVEPSIYFNEVNERQGVFHRRTFILGGLAGLSSIALIGRLADLQVVEAQQYSNLSEKNQFNFRVVVPPRGRILDRNGVEIASNRPDFRLVVRRNEVQDLDQTLDRLSQLIPLTAQRKRQLLREVSIAPRAVPVAIATGLSWEEFSRVAVRTPELPGVTAEMGEARVYPFGGAFSHVIGYVSKVSADDIKKEPNPDQLMFHPGFRIGKQGVEKALDQALRGKPGGQKVEVDSVGRVIKEDPGGDVAPTPGAEVVLTLDADIQNRALQVFGQESGAAVMMDIRTGDVLCLLSAPSFDANQFVSGAPAAYYKALAEYDHKPLLDKALAGTYPPGSTFKTMVALAALEHGVDPKRAYYCAGAWQFGNHTFHCDKHHGSQDMHSAIVTSCDIFFYNTALTVGPDRIADMARRFGLGQIFDIGIPGQKKGLVPDTEWKRRTFAKSNPANMKWFPGETPSMGIGQGYTNVNPLQLCVMVSRLANGQKALHPRLIKSVGGVEQQPPTNIPDLPVDKAHLQFVRAAMADVTTEGTAKATGQLDLGPLMMAGKTGTAQAHSYAGGHGAHGAVGAWELRDHAWFVAFAPYDDPRYAVSVLVEHGGFGADAAAPKAREIMRVALLKDPELRSRIEKPLILDTPPDTPPPLPAGTPA